MSTIDVLRRKLESIDHKDYGAYQSLLGTYQFPNFRFIVHQIPKDPFAPSHSGVYRVQVPRSAAAVINLTTDSKIQSIALRDFLARRFYDAAEQIAGGRRGTGNSGIITIDRPGQAILERSSVVLTDTDIEVRCFLGLPASGRRIDASTAQNMLFKELPAIVDMALYKDKDEQRMLQLYRHVHTAEDAAWLRNRLSSQGLIAFIADGAILPRQSGVSDAPMDPNTAIAFHSPESLRVEVQLPHAGAVTGMGIPEGITLIVGGGYHGKSTLLDVIAAGIYNHIPGDGREQCVCLPHIVKVRACSGRSIQTVDISPFIQDLPFQKPTTAFSSQNASGSTSQAATIIEALEVGATGLLMDEDTCATNFMIRDHLMQQLVNKSDEPITTFLDKVQQLYAEKNVSTILVLGGSGDYFAVAHRIIQLAHYRPLDVTPKAHAIADKHSGNRIQEGGRRPFYFHARIPLRESIDPKNQFHKKRIQVPEVQRLIFGRSTIDLVDLEQLIEVSQIKAIGHALDYARRYMDGTRTLQQIVMQIEQEIEAEGLDILSDRINANLAAFRAMELAFVLNRLRGVEMIQEG